MIEKGRWPQAIAESARKLQTCSMASQKRFNFGRAGTLFNRKTIKRELTKRRFDPAAEQLKAAKNWAAQVRHPNFRKANETAVRGEFI